MKYVFLSILSIALFACTSEDQEFEVGERTTMEVETVYDAGKVVKGELIRAKFVVKNTGDHPLVIGNVSPSCSCTVSEYPEDPIQPGKTGTIIATVDTDKVGIGKIDKKVRVNANTKPRRTELKIKATVVAK